VARKGAKNAKTQRRVKSLRARPHPLTRLCVFAFFAPLREPGYGLCRHGHKLIQGFGDYFHLYFFHRPVSLNHKLWLDVGVGEAERLTE
jgi:hypothetical protein